MIFMIPLLWCGLGLVPAHASPISGTWQYDGFIYEGNRYPNPRTNFFLTFTFTEAGGRLFWRSAGEPGFCERVADYRFENGYLYQKVTWVNPNNKFECSKDPDMQLGLETATPYRLEADYLQLHFQIRGQPFIYLLKKIGCVMAAPETNQFFQESDKPYRQSS